MQQDQAPPTALMLPTLDSFWSIPPIQDSLALHLTRTEFRNLVRVSRLLNENFIPFLWRDIVPAVGGDMLPLFFASAAQPRYRHHVRHLHLNIPRRHALAFQESIDTYGPLPRLTSFAYGAYYASATLGCIRLAESHPTLTSLVMTRQLLSSQFFEIFQRVLSNCRLCLRLVEIQFFGKYSHSDIIRILQMVTAGTVGVEVFKIDAIEEIDCLVLYLDSFEFTENRVKVFTFGPPDSNSDVILIKFLEQSPQLERLVLMSYLDNEVLAQNLGYTLGSRCPRLQELSFETEAQSTPVLSVLCACPRLRRLAFCLNIKSSQVMEGMLKRHGETLEYLRMQYGAFCHLEDFFLVMSSCPRLKDLTIEIEQLPLKDDRWSKKEDLARVEGTTWVCMGLERLDLIFKVELKLQAVLDLFLVQLGRMKCLWYLDLKTWNSFRDTTFTDVFVESLDLLLEMKDMREFYYSENNVFALKDMHHQQLVRQWPRLKVCQARPEK